MKKTITILALMFSLVTAQGDIYPTETAYGGGIGFSTMYMVLDSLPGEELFTRFGLGADNLNYRPLVFHGGEGFAQMTGPWRLGGYAGIGSAQASNALDIVLFSDKNNNDTLDVATETDQEISGKSISIRGRISFLMGAMTIEYVYPIYRDLEVMAGALFGVGRYSVSIDRYRESPNWEKLSHNMNGYASGNNFFVPVDGNWDADNKKKHLDEIQASTTELSGVFFNFQPYVAVKWQFLDRMGLRISAGYNKGTIGAGKWKTYGGIPVDKSPKSALQGITIRTVIYFGL